jgi:lysozyme
MLNGRDFASYQGQISAADWRGKIQFGIVKCTESNFYENPDYHEQLQVIRDIGAVPAHYHLAHPEQTSAAAELAYFLARADLRPGEGIALDCEPQFYGLVTPQAGAAFNVVFDHAILSRYHAHAWMYGTEWLIAQGYFEGVRNVAPLWYASPGADPAHPPVPPRPWLVSFLQYAVIGGVDADAGYFGSADQLRKLCIPQPPPPVPPKLAQARIEAKTLAAGAAGLSKLLDAM